MSENEEILRKIQKMVRSFMHTCDVADVSYRMGVVAGLEFVCVTGAQAGMTADELCSHLKSFYSYFDKTNHSSMLGGPSTETDEMLDEVLNAQNKKGNSE